MSKTSWFELDVDELAMRASRACRRFFHHDILAGVVSWSYAGVMTDRIGSLVGLRSLTNQVP